MQHCDECTKGSLKKQKVEYKLLGQSLGQFDAVVCDACHETIFRGDTFQQIEQIAKERVDAARG